MQVADSLGIKVPEQLGVFGFANEEFTEIIKPTLSSVDQKSKELGRHAANVYFKNIHKRKGEPSADKIEIIKSEIIIRQSSQRIPALNFIPTGTSNFVSTIVS